MTRVEMVRTFHAGRDAGRAGEHRLSCPYDPRVQGMLTLLWVRGYQQGLAERQREISG